MASAISASKAATMQTPSGQVGPTMRCRYWTEFIAILNAMPILGRSYHAIPILGRTYNVPVLDGCVMRCCIGAEVSRNAYIRSELQCECSLVLGLTAV